MWGFETYSEIINPFLFAGIILSQSRILIPLPQELADGLKIHRVPLSIASADFLSFSNSSVSYGNIYV
jgi:hypothetical protein